MKKFIITVIVSAFASICILPACTADANPPVNPDKKEASARPIPFHGTIDSVNKQANTVKVGERVFQITPATRIIKNNKPATLDDAKAGEEVGGAYRESADKKLNLVSLRVGPKPEVAPKKGEKN